ncbi:chaperonin TCP-1 delta subunit [Acrasis kona]|uniref:T-complex protein 1 subunit delta n=1 Tax=Acrasis kona TaxID=1008807 RepID=A0AAW2Z0X3_9EUKA
MSQTAATPAAPAKQASQYTRGNRETTTQDKTREGDVRTSNIVAAKGVTDVVRTSLGPRGMDKMLVMDNGEVVITNDGATILQKLQLVELSKAQDIEAGDGTTSVVVLAGSLLDATQKLMGRGIHPTVISDAFKLCIDKSREVLVAMSTPVDLNNKEEMVKAAQTSLSSKVVSQYSEFLAPLSVDAVLRVLPNLDATNVDLRDIHIVKKLGGLMEDTELVDGLVFSRSASKTAGGPTRIKNAKIALIQFCLSPPKTDMDNNIVVSDIEQVDRLIREERTYLLNMCKAIKKSGANVLLVQKSILRDATTEMSLHFLAKMNIMVVQDIERNEVEFISKTLNCKPIANIDSMKPEKLGSAEVVEEVSTGDGKIIKITGIPGKGKTVTALVRASNKLILDETDRSLHDALCVVRSLVKDRRIISGGSAPEVELSLQLSKYSRELQGAESYCVRAFAEALDIIPTTLAENAGLHPIAIVTELRNRHAKGEHNAGINVREGIISDMREINVIQPLLTTWSALSLATETVRMILKIDDIVEVR